MDWRDKAACLTADPELFFPVGNTGPAVDQIEKAKAVCGRCTVTEMCLQYALETSQDSGVWGGLSEDERRALKRRAARARRASLTPAPTPRRPSPPGAGGVVVRARLLRHRARSEPVVRSRAVGPADRTPGGARPWRSSQRNGIVDRHLGAAAR